MKKVLTFLICFIGFWPGAKADHITGGEMFYSFNGTANGEYQYSFTVKFYKDCHINRALGETSFIVVYDKKDGSFVKNVTATLMRIETLNLSNPNKCITDPPLVCYNVGYYQFDVSLPPSANGYIVASQVNFRINGISNLQPGYSNTGAAYTAEIPAMTPITSGPQNNSARFTGNDLVVVCANNAFQYSFAAQDADGDELRYSFCNAFQSTGGGGGANTPPPGPPPYQSVPYGRGFTGTAPLGSMVHVNSQTGLITGIAPDAGIYVVTVCVEEIRNGVVIATQRKDLQIKIASCQIAAASIQPVYMLCGESKTLSIANTSTSPLINSIKWTVTTSRNAVLFTTSEAQLTYTFADTGTYKVKLVINDGQECSDSATSIVRVYPGFKPLFDVKGFCFGKPTSFADQSTTVYGAVNAWQWDFGESAANNNVVKSKDATYLYTGMGAKKVRLVVGNSVGCIDTITKSISILDKPPLQLKFRDTLICSRDAVQLLASGSGRFSWAPAGTITNGNTATPTVAPKTNTTYFVALEDDGCINNDSVLVRVTDKVFLQAMNDTTICSGDSFRLMINSTGFQFNWTPAATLSNAQQPQPICTPTENTTYEVTANIGSCIATDQVVVKTVPYPIARAGNDTTICFDTQAQLTGSIVGSTSVWTPAATVLQPNTANTVAAPVATTRYVLLAYDTQGCPKPGRDTIVVTVLPHIAAFAGRDTAIIAGQPLQLTASGGVQYQWAPNDYLSAANIANPLLNLPSTTESEKYKVLVYNEAGCVDSAFITIKVFKTAPTVFVPTAFTPNGDGKNDVLKPIAVGMQRIDYFIIYNRWGQQVFSTTINGAGWDGTIQGQGQGTGAFVWVVKAVDFTGKQYVEKGTVTLIR